MIISITIEFYIRMVNFLPSQATTSINVTALDVATNLVIIAPASVVQGGAFTINGQLTRADTGVALTGQTISVSYNGQPLGSPVTDAQGVYSIQAIINETGNFTLTASFAGMSGFMGSEALRGISISRFVVSSALLIPVIVGGLIAYLSRKFL